MKTEGYYHVPLHVFFVRCNCIARTKYNVDSNTLKRTYNGIVFDSIIEMNYYRDVCIPMLESGQLTDVGLQIPFELQEKFIHDGLTVRPITYVADFVLCFADGHEEVVDVKGMADSTAILKRKLFWHKYPDRIYKWISYVKKYGGWIDYDELRRKRRENRKCNKPEKQSTQ